MEVEPPAEVQLRVHNARQRLCLCLYEVTFMDALAPTRTPSRRVWMTEARGSIVDQISAWACGFMYDGPADMDAVRAQFAGMLAPCFAGGEALVAWMVEVEGRFGVFQCRRMDPVGRARPQWQLADHAARRVALATTSVEMEGRLVLNVNGKSTRLSSERICGIYTPEGLDADLDAMYQEIDKNIVYAVVRDDRFMDRVSYFVADSPAALRAFVRILIHDGKVDEDPSAESVAVVDADSSYYTRVREIEIVVGTQSLLLLVCARAHQTGAAPLPMRRGIFANMLPSVMTPVYIRDSLPLSSPLPPPPPRSVLADILPNLVVGRLAHSIIVDILERLDAVACHFSCRHKTLEARGDAMASRMAAWIDASRQCLQQGQSTWIEWVHDTTLLWAPLRPVAWVYKAGWSGTLRIDTRTGEHYVALIHAHPRVGTCTF